MKPVIISFFAHRLLNFIILIFIPLAIVAPHGVVWETIIGGLIGLYYSRKQQLTELPQHLILILLAFPLWGLVTSLWSKYPNVSLLMSLKILSLVILGLYWCRLTLSLPYHTQRSLIRSFLGGLFFGILFLIIDKWTW